jgi:predicted DNA-binding transcriptional regulator AlpA
VSNDRAIGRAATVASARGWQPVRGLRREEAARYVGVSPTKFDQLVADGRMPKPIRIDGCLVWDRWELDLAFDALRDQYGGANPWD